MGIQQQNNEQILTDKTENWLINIINDYGSNLSKDSNSGKELAGIKLILWQAKGNCEAKHLLDQREKSLKDVWWGKESFLGGSTPIAHKEWPYISGSRNANIHSFAEIVVNYLNPLIKELYCRIEAVSDKNEKQREIERQLDFCDNSALENKVSNKRNSQPIQVEVPQLPLEEIAQNQSPLLPSAPFSNQGKAGFFSAPPASSSKSKNSFRKNLAIALALVAFPTLCFVVCFAISGFLAGAIGFVAALAYGITMVCLADKGTQNEQAPANSATHSI